MQTIIKFILIGTVLILAGYVVWLNIDCGNYHVSHTTFKINSQRVNLLNYEYFKRCDAIPDDSGFYSQNYNGIRNLGSCGDLKVPVIKDSDLQDHFGNFFQIKDKKRSQKGLNYKIESLGKDGVSGGKSLEKDLVEDYFLFSTKID